LRNAGDGVKYESHRFRLAMVKEKPDKNMNVGAVSPRQ
jgi:hypothetical protein